MHFNSRESFFGGGSNGGDSVKRKKKVKGGKPEYLLTWKFRNSGYIIFRSAKT